MTNMSMIHNLLEYLLWRYSIHNLKSDFDLKFITYDTYIYKYIMIYLYLIIITRTRTSVEDTDK